MLNNIDQPAQRQGPSRRMIIAGTATGAAVIAAGTATAIVFRDQAPASVAKPPSSTPIEIAREDEVPTGGGLVVPHANVVLTRDTQGNLRAFSATCTHAGCTIAEVAEGRIKCPCHGSRYDATTGRPVSGPAKRALLEVAIAVRDGVITTG
ncbi:Rieske (2Fe-2S) protein [Micromonospora sp. 4G55]|uniref:Rieske (2Fe-2S) protein n=1 Tax=Micromonospora sp. 4G55 TaxID=2806102 RepID=UPI001A5538A9|nr:Rieske (2Fe-2S) protein [Micromonospora sp. 4G55]